MCIALPVKVIETDEKEAVVELNGITKRINTALIAEVRVGDYLLLHSGSAIKKIDAKAAQNTLEAFELLAQEVEEDR